MCRIAGFWDFNYKGEYDINSVLTQMRDVLSYGGPDDAGRYLEHQEGLAMSHRRLSIIDLSISGHQPMSDEDGNLWITYNGEVYNYKEIRQDLEYKGYKFSSTSDTEVVLKAYKEWGFECVHRFRGMWAFAIWNESKEELVLCRDRMGVKPLYWYYKDGLFMFASELKSFHKHPHFYKELDTVALSLYLQYGYITSPYSIFKYTYKLEPGYFLVINQKKEPKKIPYWDINSYFLQNPQKNEKWLRRSEDEIALELEDILTESFKLRLVADVPVGIFLSGGIDSSLVAALLQKELSKPLKTFTIGFYEKRFNEAHWAKGVAKYLGTDHAELYCTPSEAFEIIPQLPEIYDEPFGDSSAIPTFLVSGLAKQRVKVSLSADGGDEQFFGYTRYWMASHKKMPHLPSIKLSSLLFEVAKWIEPDTAFALYDRFKFILPKFSGFRDKYAKLKALARIKDLAKKHDVLSKYFLGEELHILGLRDIDDNLFKLDLEIDALKKLMLIDLKTYLPDDILVKVDRATMAVALEGREPFLDNKILEFSSQLPVGLKYKKGISKYILKKILYKYVPERLVNRPKQGFGVPIHEWFRKELKPLYAEYLNVDRIKKGGILNPERISDLLEDYFNDKGVDGNKLWLILMFEMWRERWL